MRNFKSEKGTFLEALGFGLFAEPQRSFLRLSQIDCNSLDVTSQLKSTNKSIYLYSGVHLVRLKCIIGEKILVAKNGSNIQERVFQCQQSSHISCGTWRGAAHTLH